MRERDNLLTNIYRYTGKTYRTALIQLEEELAEIAEYKIARFSEMSGQKILGTTIVLADWVIDKPENVLAEDAEKFYEYCYEFVSKRIGKECMVGDYVQSEQDVECLHCLFVPMVKGRSGVPKFDFRQIMSRAEYKAAYEQLAVYLQQRLGYRPNLDCEKRAYSDSDLSEEMKQELLTTKKAFVDSSELMKKSLTEAAEAAGRAALKSYSALPKTINAMFQEDEK